MKTKIVLMAGVAVAALVAVPGYAAKSTSGGTSYAPAAAPAANDARYDELAARVDALEAELQAAEIRAAADHDKVASWKPVKGWWDSTKISGRMYYNITNIKNDHSSGTDGTAFDIKRFYVGIDHKFNKVFSANVTTDFTYDSTVGASQVYIKKAYLSAKLDDAFTVRVGATDLPWVPYAEKQYGYRFIENTLADHSKFGTSADWGVHFIGKLAKGVVNYQVSVINGSGYKKAGSTSFRTEQPDVEGRVSIDYDAFHVAVGGYWGRLGAKNSDTVYHDAYRFNAIAAYRAHGLRLGVEYFYADNWTQVKSATSSHGYGVSPFASYQLSKQWAIFGRYDYVKPYSDAARKDFENNYYNVGIVYSPTKIVDFALVYKHDGGQNGYYKTSNGTIGGSAFGAGNDGDYDEFGLFGRLRW